MFKTVVTKVYADLTADPINPFPGTTTVKGLITIITNLLIAVGLGVTVIMIALAFIGFATSQGDEEKTKNAQNWLTYAVIGGIGLFLVYTLRAVILNLVGVDETQIPGYSE